jgi:hypothetical protein
LPHNLLACVAFSDDAGRSYKRSFLLLTPDQTAPVLEQRAHIDDARCH